MKNHMKILLDTLILLALLLVLSVLLTDGFTLDLYGLHISARHLNNPVVLLLLLLSTRYLIFGVPEFIKRQSSITWPRDYGIRGVVYFVLTVVCVKSFVSFIVIYHFKQAMTVKDMVFTYSADLALGFVMVVVLLVAGLIGGAGKNNLLLKHGSLLIYFFVSVISISYAIFYVICGYIFFEWGAFLEPQHFQAMRMARVGDEFVDLFFRWPTIVAFGVIAFLYVLSAKIQKKVFPLTGVKAWSVSLLVLLPFALSAIQPIKQPRLFSPSVASPIFLMHQPVAGNQGGVKNINLLKGIDPNQFTPPKTAPISDAFQQYEGIAKGKNLVFVVMESVRRRNVGLYGYTRDTMPTFSRLANQSLVFQNAYVMQPRSSKAMAALALGIMPDPRLVPLSWEPQRLDGKDTFFMRVLNEGRRFYQGTAQPYGGDRLQDFFHTVTHHVKQPVVSLETLVEDQTLPNDDRGLAQHFLRWVNENDDPFVGLLWTECAHMPYDTEDKPFGEDNLVDKYDNCLRQVDDAVGVLVEGLDKAGKLDDTLIVIFGDHGEALGEHFDRGHGSFLFEHSMSIPFIIYSPDIFRTRVDVMGRFQLKDVPATLLYLLGLPDNLNQSVNIFSKGARDKLYMSNVYQDFKLGILFDQTKFVYRPRFDMVYIYDLDTDPLEKSNISHQYNKKQLDGLKHEVLTWYKYQTQYVERNYPRKPK